MNLPKVNLPVDRNKLKDTVFRVTTGLHRELYRRTGGKLGGKAGKMQMMLLTTTGRSSGQPRTTPLNCISDGDRFLAVASYGGDDRDPQWFKNLQAKPDATIQVGADTIPVRASVASPEERTELWPKVVAAYKGYDSYQRRTERSIPVVILTRQAGA
ncbi:MAG TPA: nitroreductase family deazaflavin-dependent oxidoreductase [Acidimicrobiia bacterium]|nr:nitroreductase family deazaflavin-dependent oxidoreductase [Acidimicrobiia bacterium]